MGGIVLIALLVRLNSKGKPTEPDLPYSKRPPKRAEKKSDLRSCQPSSDPGNHLPGFSRLPKPLATS